MKSVFIDTNVIIDFLANRKPFSLAAAQIFDLSVRSKIKLFVATVSYNNIYYILNQSLSHEETIELLDELYDMTEAADVTKAVIKKALKSGFKDFEDAIQYYCALTINQLDFIITRNKKDFRKSSLPVLTPEEAVHILEEES